ncbi:MAG: hypothetical protein QG602_1590 [Verrucomicrobiota bacterium]|nr:hypothetical protein [Verrucomicrobiota bacterium]
MSADLAEATKDGIVVRTNAKDTRKVCRLIVNPFLAAIATKADASMALWAGSV